MSEYELYLIIEKYFNTYEIKRKCKEINRLDNSLEIEDIKQDVFIKLHQKIDMFEDKKIEYIIVSIDNAIINIHRYISKNYRRKVIPNIKSVIGDDLVHLFDLLSLTDEQRRIFLFCSKSCSSERLMLPDIFREKGKNVLNSKFRDEAVEIINRLIYMFGNDYLSEFHKSFFLAMIEKKSGKRVKLKNYPMLSSIYDKTGRRMMHDSCTRVLRELFLSIVEYLESCKIIKIQKL